MLKGPGFERFPDRTGASVAHAQRRAPSPAPVTLANARGKRDPPFARPLKRPVAPSLVKCQTAPGQGSPPHLQRHDLEAFYVLEGEYEFTLGGEAQTHGPGGFMLVPRDVPHHFRNPGKAPARMLILNTPGGLHEGFFRDAGEPARPDDAFPWCRPACRA